jgi:phenylalanyl-tRNA synthetase beta chain
MLVSLKKIREFVDFEMSIEELDNTLTMLGLEVESIVDYNKKYTGFYVAEVTECEKHPNADKLSVCQVNFGGDTVQVVCGAPNVRKGQKVVFGTIGAVVPNGGFKLEKRKIRDVVSFGMICSQVELDLGEESSGIWVLPEDAPVGMEFAKYYGLDDVVLEIGITPNKADCLSHLGIAREIAAKLNKKFRYPEIKVISNNENSENYASITIEDASICPRYSARIIKNVKIQPSPNWLRNALTKLGIRPINAAVDVTNYVLYEMGQPLHAFDYNKIEGNKIIVRKAKKEEAFVTLDGKTRILDDYMIVIADEKKPIALGGVMGGENSEITDDTTDILLESAYFNPSLIRKTSKILGLSSDSSYRFERGVDIENVIPALNRAAVLIAELCGGEIVGSEIDVYPEPVKLKEIALRFERARKIIGCDISNDFMLQVFENLGFEKIEQTSEYVKYRIPHRRNDIFEEIDLIEEVARFYNYDNIEPNYVSSITFSESIVDDNLQISPLKNKIRHFIVSNGFTEILTQNMVDTRSAEIFTSNPVKIANPLGEELSIMRPSIVPSILKTINLNIRYGNTNLKIFEIGKIFKHTDDNKALLPGYEEREILAISLIGKTFPKQWSEKERPFDFYDLKGFVEDFADFLRLPISFSKIDSDGIYSPNSLKIELDNYTIGYCGYVNRGILKNYDIEEDVLLAEIDFSQITHYKTVENKYEPVSPFPTVDRDLAFIVDESTEAKSLLDEIRSNGGKLLSNVLIFDVYAGKNIPEGKKSLAFSLIFSSSERTLTDEEVDSTINQIIKAVENKFNAQLRKM